MPLTETQPPISAGSTGPHVLALQYFLNRNARRLQLPLISEDGVFGDQTAEACGDVAFKLGIVGTPRSVELVPHDLLRLIEDPSRREPSQVACGTARQIAIGEKLTASHYVRGLQVLKLISDWNSWVHRRIERFTFGNDDTVLVRERTMDFTLARALGEARSSDPVEFTVPLTLATKWRLPRFEIRDESGHQLPLLARGEHAPIAAAAMIILAYLVVGGCVPSKNDEPLPAQLERDLRAIAHEERTEALKIFDSLLTTPEEAADQMAEARWRTRLAADRRFMEVAYEFAQHFVVLVPLICLSQDRRIVTMSYEWVGNRPAHPVLGRTGWRRFSTSSSLVDADADLQRPRSPCEPADARIRAALPDLSVGQRILRGLGWRGRPILIRLRLGDGGSYHFEFTAPPGLQISEARLADELYPALARESRVFQRVHLYLPRRSGPASMGFARIDLRARPETILRPAVFTSLFATLSLCAIALRWSIEGSPGGTAAALLLGVPGGLAAYVSQAIPSPVTSAMVSGLRLLGLVPGLLAFGGAAVILLDRGADWASAYLWVLVVLSTLVTTALMIAALRTDSEDAASAGRSPSRERVTAYPFRTTWTPPMTDVAAALRRDYARIEDPVRRELFEEDRPVRRGTREIAPSLYVDAAEAPVVSQALSRSPALLRQLDAAIAELADDPEAVRAAYEQLVGTSHRLG